MRKYRFKQVEKYIKLFRMITEGIYECLSQKPANLQKASEYLEICQQRAIELGEFIEKEEGEKHPTVTCLEEFCEVLFQVHEEMISERGLHANSAEGRITHCINEVEKSAKADIKITQLWIFMPYKASMWDSMESIWQAASSDENCTALVVPIPYYDKNENGEFIREHYEGDMFPEYVSITKYDEVDYVQEHPDVVFFHNPYDQYNYVTTVHPFFYSDKLKAFTNCLVYVPYFATAGGMGEGQAYMPSFENADFLVVQSNEIIDFYKRVPREKFLPLGSPKFDSVIKKCENPPEPPSEWKEKMDGKKVYFYNTSLSGMLDDPKVFFEKMEYVFSNFKARNDVCLLWRPHPLFESTLESMVPEYLPRYIDIRDRYIKENYGIYDTTACIEDSIALSDAYIGDSGTSVTSLFGVVGKPIFILNNQIHELPGDDDWKAYFVPQFLCDIAGKTYNKYYVAPGNDLYYSANDDMHFEFFCKLSSYSTGGYYQRAIEHKDKIYVIPANAQDILVIEANTKNIMKIELEKNVARDGAFAGCFVDGNYVYILPNLYGSLIRLNMDSNETSYLTKVADFNIAITKDMERVIVARWQDADNLYFLSANGDKLLTVNKKTMKPTTTETGFMGIYVGAGIEKYNDDVVWLLPYEGTTVKEYNYKKNICKDYDLSINGLKGFDRINKIENNRRLFASVAFNRDEIIFAPYWGNSFVSLNRETGEVKPWDSPFNVTKENVNTYVLNYGVGYFIKRQDKGEGEYSYFDAIERKQYSIDLKTKEKTLEEQFFSKEDVFGHVSGYSNASHQQRYCCNEDIYNSLKNLLDENIHGHQHNREEQLEEFKAINASPAGDCGEKVYEYLK